jgi:hypothetical protein
MPNTIRVLKLRRIRCAGSIPGGERSEMQELDHLQYQDIGEKIILKWSLRKQDARV